MTDGLRVSLQLYEDKFHEQLLAFQLPPEQAQFTALPAESLPEALRAPDKLAVVITGEEQAAGFFILHTGARIAEFYSNYSEAALVRAFLVNSPCQGRGIAKSCYGFAAGFCPYPTPASS
ncbi:hypothetical protein [Paenibacillus typhae]|uniref:N-acetyltransferase domain-containing protein n=1 Tax=Paenibacillus typhae TaxID=1174501 RepID=A0A1G9APK0_9BACL|nr:hypothetical protein [Paenibacillus typhae]SDK28510.1 hypothetical protein SAMN05216192_13714 [Paenibacillus typhae]